MCQALEWNNMAGRLIEEKESALVQILSLSLWNELNKGFLVIPGLF